MGRLEPFSFFISQASTLLLCDGKSYEGDEGSANESNEKGRNENHESHEAHEEKSNESFHRWTRNNGKGARLEGCTKAYCWWFDSQRSHEKQAWKGCQQKGAQQRCEKPLDDCCQGRAQGFGHYRLVPVRWQNSRRESIVCQG